MQLVASNVNFHTSYEVEVWHDKFGKRIVLNLKTRIHLKKKPRGQNDEMFQNLSIRMAKCF